MHIYASLGGDELRSSCWSTHWGRVTHICVSKLTIIDSDNGLSHDRRQAIIWTNAGILLIAPMGTNFSEFLIEIHAFAFKKMHLKMSSGKWRPFCLGLNVLNQQSTIAKATSNGCNPRPQPQPKISTCNWSSKVWNVKTIFILELLIFLI